MRIVRLRQSDDLGFRHSGAEYAAEIFQDDTTAQRQQAIKEPPGQRRFRARGKRQRNRRRAYPVVRQRHCNRPQALQPQQPLRPVAADDLGRTVSIALDRKIGRLDLPECQLAREEFGAGFLGGKARCEASRPTRPVTAVGEFLRRENAGQVFGGRVAQQALDARDFDAIDATARRVATLHCERVGGAGHPGSRQRADDQRGIGPGKAPAQDQCGVAPRHLRAGGNAQALAVRVERA